MNPRKPVLLLVCLLAAASASPARAYELEGIHWPSDQPITLGLQLGVLESTLSDGSTSFGEVFKAATAVWNPYLGSGVQLATRDTLVPQAQGDGNNTVFFSDTFFGESFGDDTLATTAYLYHTSDHAAYEADIGFNTAKAFNSYRGALRTGGSVRVYDLRRVAIHELGHVLGLAHVAQSATAIMTPDTTDIDTIQADDIAGVESLYGDPHPVTPVITGSLSGGGIVGDGFAYQISAAHRPTSYGATGLPPGLSVDPQTGLISGLPKAAGDYRVTIEATNAAGTGTATLELTFGQIPKITGNLNFTAYVGRVFYDQVTTLGHATGFRILNGTLPPGVTLDPATGLLAGTPTQAGDFFFGVVADNAAGSDQESFEVVVKYDATLTIVGNGLNTTALLRAADGNLYGTSAYGGNSGNGSFYRLAPDGSTVTLYSFFAAGAYLPGDLHQAADGSFYGTNTRGGVNGTGAVFRLGTDGIMATVGNFPGALAGAIDSATVLLGADGNYYGTLRPFVDGLTHPGGQVYRLAPDGTFTTLHAFDGTDGFFPSALIQAGDGSFYGTTYKGGGGGLGTVFKITPDGTLTTLHGFTAAEGAYPLAALVQAADGSFYGTTSAVGDGSGAGTVFRLGADGTLTTLHTFAYAEGRPLTAALTQDGDGNFYGAAGGYFVGLALTGATTPTLFKLTPDGTPTTLHTFTGVEGTPTSTALVPDGAGNFYGVSVSALGGFIFKETPGAVPVSYAPPMPGVVPTVTWSASPARVTVGSGGAAVVTATLSSAPTAVVKVHYVVRGSAINGTDYPRLGGTLKIKPGQTSKAITIVPTGDLEGAANRAIKLVLTPGDDYTVGTTTPVKVKILHGK